MARERRRSRVLEYFEQQQAQREQQEADPDQSQDAGGEEPFREFEAEFESVFGPDFFDSKGNE